MTQLNDGSEARAKESPEETMRFRAVEVAYQLLSDHPKWLRGYGFAVPNPGSAEFLKSMRELKEELERVVGWETYNEQDLPRRPAPPDYLEVILIAVHLLLTNQKPVRPLPVLLGSTWLAMCFFYENERRQEDAGSDDIDWTVDDVIREAARTMH